MGCLNSMLGSGQTENGETSAGQSQEHAHHFLWHQRDCSQIIRPGRPNSPFHVLLWCFMANCMKMWEDFAPNFGNKRTGCCITITHCLTLPFSPRNFWPRNNLTVILTHPTFLFPPLKLKLKGHHFDTTEVIKSELQAMLNTPTEHDSQAAFKKCQKHLK
jgi:hypothetical protein